MHRLYNAQWFQLQLELWYANAASQGSCKNSATAVEAEQTPSVPSEAAGLAASRVESSK